MAASVNIQQSPELLTWKQQPFAKAGVLLGRKGQLSMKVSIYDSATGEFNMATDLYERALTPALYKMGLALKTGVKREFQLAQTRYINTPFTTMAKGGKPPLEDSGSLKRAMSDITNGIEPIIRANQRGVKVSFEIPESVGTGHYPQYRRNNNFEYLWVHEMFGAMMTRKLIFSRRAVGNYGGSGYQGYMIASTEKTPWKLTKRPFFIKGVQRGRKDALIVGRDSINQYFLANMQSPRYKPRWLTVSPVPSLAPRNAMGMVMYVAPPSSIYKYPGMWGDFMGIMSGALLSERAILGYIRQYAWGQIGMTKKSIRRKTRRRIYYGR